MEFIFELGNIETVAKKVISLNYKYTITAFSGELGAGKTTLIAAICKALGVKENVTSPTYSIIQQYVAGKKNIYHIDLYRIKNAEEAIDAGVEDCIQSGDVCLVEWPEKAFFLFPEKTVFISLQPLPDNKRKLIVQLPR